MTPEPENELQQLRRELAELKAARGGSEDSLQSIEGLHLLTLRIGVEGTIRYANTALARYCGVDKHELIGQPVSVLARQLGSEVVKVIKSSDDSSSAGVVLARDSRQRLLEIRTSLKESIRDVVLHDVTDHERMRAYARKYFPADLDKLSDDDLSSFKFPERRFMTVGFTDLRGFTAMSELLSPEEVRAVVNAFMEEVVVAIDESGGSIDKFMGDEVMALYGAPLYYQDHAFRAVQSACLQIERVEKLRLQFQKGAKELPPCGIGLNAGDMVLGNMGSSTRQNYTVLGPAVNLASRLCGAAKGGQALLSESFFHLVTHQLPEGWATKSWKEDSEPFAERSASGSVPPPGKVENIRPLPEELQGRVIGIGPEGQKPAFVFRYLYCLEVKGIQAPIVTLAVERGPEEIAIPLSTDKAEQDRSERLLGRYRLGKLIGRGGMGEVWRARDQFGNRVAIKTLLSGEAATEAQILRFRREAKIMSRLDHRNICRIHEVGEWERQHYIAMELVDGISLRDLLRSPEGDSVADTAQPSTKLTSRSNSGTKHTAGSEALSSLIKEVKSELTRKSDVSQAGSGLIPVENATPGAEKKRGRVLPLQQALSLIHQIGEAVQAAHQAGVLHRDLKPANILLRDRGEPIVMDFGLAKLHREGSGEGLSMSGQLLGTIEYMAPEQARDSREMDERADIFSLGSILFEMLTGRKVLQTSGNMLADSKKLEEFEPQRPSKWNRKLDSDIDAMILKALDPQPNRRYRSVGALIGDIDSYQRGEVISAKTPSSLEILWKLIRRNAAVSITIAIAAVFFIVGGAYSIYWIDRKRAEAVAAQEASELQRAASDAIHLLEHEPQQGLELAQKAAETSLDKFGVVLPHVRFCLADAMQKARQVWRAYLGQETVDSLVIVPVAKGAAPSMGFEAPLLIAAIAGNHLYWLDGSGALLAEPIALAAGEQTCRLRLARDGAGVFIRDGAGSVWYQSSFSDELSPVAKPPFDFWQPLRETREDGIRITSFSRSVEGVTAEGGVDGKVFLLDAYGQPYGDPIPGHFDAVTAVSFDPSGQLLASGAADRTIRVIGAQGQFMGDAIKGHEGAVTALAWSEDSFTLISGSADGTVRRWDMRQFQAKPPEKLDGPSPEIVAPTEVLSPSGGRLARYDAKARALVITKRPGGEELSRWSFEQPPTAISWHPSEDILAVADEGALISLLSVAYPDATPTLLYGHWKPVRALEWFDRGEVLVSGGDDSSLMLWNWRGALLAPPIIVHRKPIVQISGGEEGEITALSSQGVRRTIAVAPWRWLDQLRQRAEIAAAGAAARP